MASALRGTNRGFAGLFGLLAALVVPPIGAHAQTFRFQDTNNWCVLEDGSTVSDAIRLSEAPASNITVTLATDDSSIFTVNPTTFTPSNYAEPGQGRASTARTGTSTAK